MAAKKKMKRKTAKKSSRQVKFGKCAKSCGKKVRCGKSKSFKACMKKCL